MDKFDFKRRGIVYGGLVVPFRYYLGGDKRISASSTVALYLSVRGLGHFWGSQFTPIVSAGLGLVLTHEKNKTLTAGILFGKDFLSTEDRISDPTVDKIWMSLYIGLTVGGSK